MKIALTLCAITLASIILSGCRSNEVTSLPPGTYEQSSQSTDSQGTERSVDSTTNVYYDQQGNKKATINKTTSTDPKGLFNKSTTESSVTVK